MSKSATFSELYTKLNPAQKEAVDAIEGPVMVIAGPGTGKTTILTLRIANILLKTDTPPSGILAITFTDAGAKAMRLKLHEIIGPVAHEVKIHTFHSFAASVLSEFKDHFVHLDKMEQMTDIEAESLLRDILKDSRFDTLRPFGNPDFYLPHIISGISDAKRAALTPEMVRVFSEEERKRITDDESSYSTRGNTKGQLKAEIKKRIERCDRTRVFADVYEEYERKKREKNKIDFDDLIAEVLVALRNDTLLLQMLQEKFLYILIDEHQDTNDSQNELIKKLADFFDTPNVFVVGDEKQAIYRFQGASVENFLAFKNAWRDTKIIGLEHNYRSHQTLLDASFAMIEANYGDSEHADLRIKLCSGSSEKQRPIDVVIGEDTQATEVFLAKEIKRIITDEPGASVAIIVRTNRNLERVLDVCAKYEVPVSSERSIDIFKHPIGTLFFDLIEFLYDPTRTDLLTRTLSAGLWSVSFDESVALIRSIRSEANFDSEKHLHALSHLKKEMLKEGPLEFLITAAEKTGFIERALRDPDAVSVWRGIIELAKTLVQQGQFRDPREVLERLIAYRTSAQSRSVKVSIGTADQPIQAMTAHASKGREFDYVFIPYATEESWIGRPAGEYFILPQRRASGDVKDMRRLFYVALTRARKHATILYGKEDAGDKIVTALRFVEELDQTCISHIHLPRAKEEVAGIRAGNNRKDHIFIQKSTEYAKRTLLSSGLSVTALNHFLECPSMFLYQSILKLPQAPAATAEKGNAMHLALSRVWSQGEKNAASIETTMREAVENYFTTSLLSRFEKESVIRELLKNAPAVASSLEQHFSQEGVVFSEMWSESVFAATIGDETLAIPLHGKLDAVVETQERVLVYDYKTRKVMSEGEIRGDTKNSNGNYFRQLVFYKLLLKEDSSFKDKEIVPSLVFVSPDEQGRCPIVSFPIEDSDVVHVQEEINSLLKAVWSGSMATQLCDNADCEWCRLKKVSLD